MHKVFVYGTLKRGLRLHEYLRSGHFLGTARLQGYGLYAVSWYPAIRSRPSTEVFGELFRIDDPTLEQLDEVEDEGIMYDRVTELVHPIVHPSERDSIREPHEAFVYVYRDELKESSLIKSGFFGGA